MPGNICFSKGHHLVKVWKTRTAEDLLSGSLYQRHVLHRCSKQIAGSQAAGPRPRTHSVTLEKSFFTITTRPLLAGIPERRTRAPGLGSAAALTAFKEFTGGLSSERAAALVPCRGQRGAGLGREGSPRGEACRHGGKFPSLCPISLYLALRGADALEELLFLVVFLHSPTGTPRRSPRHARGGCQETAIAALLLHHSGPARETDDSRSPPLPIRPLFFCYASPSQQACFLFLLLPILGEKAGKKKKKEVSHKESMLEGLQRSNLLSSSAGLVLHGHRNETWA